MRIQRQFLQITTALVLSMLITSPSVTLAVTATTSYQHSSTPDVILTEIQTSSTASSGEEFIELYNNTATDIDLADTVHNGKDTWKLQYFSSSKLASFLGTPSWTSPYRTISLTGIIPAHDYYVLAAGTYQPGSIVPDQTYASTLADDGGALQLVDSITTGTNTVYTIHDQLAWSSDKALHDSLLQSSAGPGVSLQRVPNDDNEYVNDSGLTTDFIADSRISPENAWTAPVQTTTDDPEIPIDETGDSTSTPIESSPAPTTGTNAGLLVPVITELLPNPASPQTDEQNEYIELYNPGETVFNLKGYTLETGQTTLHDFTFTSDTLLEPGSYAAFFSADTGLSLSNSGGQARLLDPGDALLSQSAIYATAVDGQAWALDASDGTWHWTVTPTPGADNIIETPVVLAKASVVKTATKKATAKVKGASTTRIAKTKTTAKKSSKVKKVSTAAPFAATSVAQTTPAIHPYVLAAVAALALGYGVYEYRHDLENRIYQFRKNRTARRSNR